MLRKTRAAFPKKYSAEASQYQMPFEELDYVLAPDKQNKLFTCQGISQQLLYHQDRLIVKLRRHTS